MKRLKTKFITLNPKSRLYEFDKPIIALTGGIATGKSTVTKLLEEQGLKIIDADQLVKKIYQDDETISFIQNNFPQVMENKTINFKLLRELVFSDQDVKSKVESFIYARLPEAFKAAAARITDQEFYLYDVPLLFERKLDQLVDLKLVVYAPRDTQHARILDRDQSKTDTAEKILSQQMDIEDKKLKADFVIDNSGTMEELKAGVRELLREILE